MLLNQSRDTVHFAAVAPNRINHYLAVHAVEKRRNPPELGHKPEIEIARIGRKQTFLRYYHEQGLPHQGFQATMLLEFSCTDPVSTLSNSSGIDARSSSCKNFQVPNDPSRETASHQRAAASDFASV